MAVIARHQPAAPPARDVLALADGVELVGEYEDSGFREPPLLARRADGQMIQLTRLLYLIAAASDGRRDANAVAAEVSRRYGRGVSARNVRYLADERLRPLGVLALPDGTTPELPKREALFALRCRRPILPERAVNAIARAFTWLHRPPLHLLVPAALAGFAVWLFALHGIAPALRVVIYDPELLLFVLASTVIAAAWHECGHASACRYGGARPGVMGVGLYLVWPAFYCDVTDAYRLNRAGRLRTDLGGVYFNAIFALCAGAAYFATGQEAFLLVAFVQHMMILQQLLPLLRFDGYYVLSDLTGVPDILSRIKPILRSLVRGRRNEPRVDELKPWVRAVTTAYLLALVPTLFLMLMWTLLSAPRVLATVHDSLGLQLERIGAASGFAELTLAMLRVAGLIMPVAAISLSLGRSGRMALRGLARWSRGSAARRAVAVAAAGALAGAVGYTWWPNGDYEPIRPGERGTIGDTLASIPEFGGGRPSFTKERARRFGRVPTVREREAAPRRTGGSVDSPASPEAGATPPATPAEPTRDAGEPNGRRSSDPAAGTNDPTATPDSSTPPAATAAPSPAATPTATPGDTPTPTPTPTPAPSSDTTPQPTATATASPSPEPTAELAPTEAPALADAATATPTPTATP